MAGSFPGCQGEIDIAQNVERARRVADGLVDVLDGNDGIRHVVEKLGAPPLYRGASWSAGMRWRRVPPRRRRILVVGDSISAEYGLKRGSGWVALLQRRLAADQSPLEVVNASISGDTTSGGRSRLPALLTQHRPAVVVIELGANDALRGLPLADDRGQSGRHGSAGAHRPAPGCCWWACRCRRTTAPITPTRFAGLVPEGRQGTAGRAGAVLAEGRGRHGRSRRAGSRPIASIPPKRHSRACWRTCGRN